ncbi:HAD family hydrolase [Pseudogulbenkiania ferrooxidans]|uniref:HAD-superfamily hydrolase, subfamily IA, variant 1 n=1 Tax=Pseudogulbenkiania ferrooxidans 2002 TaxID=279714 RepID=B9Z4R4_9NEIS|nr:HAD-IA family hydrolase [Pseudogulbenkiania ferrooxidans]EEG08146.1 HAD-superfamily hydrolase, subfamily IA, variant 1 [Pseudogulbenkiania ferrooxidans 2002]
MNKTFDLIVFDWDGTLMDSTAHIATSIQKACADLGLPVPDRSAASHVIGLGLGDALRHVCPSLPEERFEDMVDAYRQHYLNGDATIELFEHVQEGLAELQQSGLFLAVATGKSRKGLDRALTETGLGTLFHASRTADECHSKPHPAMLLELTDELGVDPARTLMVGDTTHDLLMAQNAGAQKVGMSYGAHPVAALLECQPLALFDDFRSLLQWLKPQIG